MDKTNSRIWGDILGKKLLLFAMSLALITHGVIVYFTLPNTYDAYVHIFFSDHYARFWFEPWDYRWYTGFLTISYPPMVHQLVALLSKVFPLKVAFAIYSNFIIQVLIIGVYRFSKIFFDKPTAGVSAILVVLLSSIVETMHVFGQIPTLTGLAFMLNSLPFLYQFIVKRKFIYLVMALSFLSVVISSHHVTAIFGMVFFIAPTIFMALTDSLEQSKLKESFFMFLYSILREALKKYKEILLFGFIMIVLAIGLIFPYWYWSKTDPILQVSIPHGSRDNFFENFSSGLVFYIIPLTLIFGLLPAISYTILKQKRFIAWAVSFYLCLLLGSGGTTPLPELILGSNAFNILTLDRFGFWASIIAIPFMAKFIYSFIAGPVKEFWVKRFSTSNHFILAGLSGFSYLLFLIFIFHLGSFRPLQPKEVEIRPLINFLNRDDHMRWRYLTLGFGDQMAWLSANSLAATVDGNYHSARRLPELTTRPVERLENAKFRGTEGLASLQDFLTKAEKYSLKYVFSNDKYYDPLLYYSGWTRTILLENGIMVWEKGNIPTIVPVTPTELSPVLKKIWGILPITSLIVAFLLTLFYLKYIKQKDYYETVPETSQYYPRLIIYSSALLPILFFTGFMIVQINELLFLKEQKDPTTAVLNYYNHLDFQRFETAFGFFKPSPTYTIDQYLLEKSVKDGGLLPSYAKLDSISVVEISKKADSATTKVFAVWRTALGLKNTIDTIDLVKHESRWYIIPSEFSIEIPEEQMREYTFVLFKKVGKRVISSFPTVKDDKVKKPFAAFKQVNIVRNQDENFIVGELLNADDIPINVSLKAVLRYNDTLVNIFYPESYFQYNLSPKASTFFQIKIDSSSYMDSLSPVSIELYAKTDVSERGYIHGGILSYSVDSLSNDELLISSSIYNELSTDITIPGILVAEKDKNGRIWQVKLFTHNSAVRSGLNISFQNDFQKIQNNADILDKYQVFLFINGSERTALRLQPDSITTNNMGVTIIPHCFMAKDIYLQ